MERTERTINIQLVKGRKLGLEVWQVVLNGRVQLQVFSEAHARTRYIELKRDLLGQ